MLPFLLLVVGCAVLAAMLINPKVGTFLVWPVIFVYPHLYMERLDLLPWNIGVDDLFICAFFVIVVLRRNVLAATPLRIGLSLIGALVYLLIWTTANLSGWMTMPSALPSEILKPVLKYVIMVLFVFCMVHTIDSVRDVRLAAAAFLGGMTLAGLTVILHRLYPEHAWMFTTEVAERQLRWHGTVDRAVGSLSSANVGCAVLGMAGVFAIPFVRLQRTSGRKALVWATIPILLIAMVLTRSRTGAASFGAALMLMCIFSRSRVHAWIVVIGILGLIALRPGMFLEFGDRFLAAYNPEAGGQLDPNVTTRMDLWRQYAETATPQIWLFGQGKIVPVLRIGLNPHSSYVSMLFVHGLGGVLWSVVFFGFIVRRALSLSRAGIEPYGSIASGVLWSLLVWSVAGLTLDLVVTAAPRYVYLFFAVLVERCYALARQHAAVPTVPAAARVTLPPAGYGRLTPQPAT